MKRKDFVDVDDDAFLFPSYKSRRLDAEFFATVNEDLKSAHQVFEQSPAPDTSVIETDDEEAIVPCGDDKAIVLYNPSKTGLIKAPDSRDFAFIVNSDLVPGLKDCLYSWRNTKSQTPGKDLVAEEGKEDSNGCMAIVPWVASKFSLASKGETQEASQAEPMEAEEVEMMDTDDVGYNPVEVPNLGGVVVGGPNGLPQWHQQQVQWMNPQLQQNYFTPAT